MRIVRGDARGQANVTYWFRSFGSRAEDLDENVLFQRYLTRLLRWWNKILVRRLQY